MVSETDNTRVVSDNTVTTPSCSLNHSRALPDRGLDKLDQRRPQMVGVAREPGAPMSRSPRGRGQTALDPATREVLHAGEHRPTQIRSLDQPSSSPKTSGGCRSPPSGERSERGRRALRTAIDSRGAVLADESAQLRRSRSVKSASNSNSSATGAPGRRVTSSANSRDAASIRAPKCPDTSPQSPVAAKTPSGATTALR